MTRAVVALVGAASGILLVTPTASATPAPPAGATKAITVNGAKVSYADIDLSNPAQVETLLLRIGAAQHSTSGAFLFDVDVTPQLRAAIVSTVTRPMSPIMETHTGTYPPEQTMAHLTDAVGATKAASIMAQPNAANSVSCGWAEKTARYSPGQVQYYWFRLHTDFCWDGYNVQGTPGVWHDGGASWGWSYSGSFQSLTGWPAPQAWKSYAGCTMAYAWYLRNHPWVQQIVNGQGWVQTSWSDT